MPPTWVSGGGGDFGGGHDGGVVQDNPAPLAPNPDLRAWYHETDFVLYAWEAVWEAHLKGEPLADWVMQYLAECANRLTAVAIAGEDFDGDVLAKIMKLKNPQHQNRLKEAGVRLRNRRIYAEYCESHNAGEEKNSIYERLSIKYKRAKHTIENIISAQIPIE